MSESRSSIRHGTLAELGEFAIIDLVTPTAPAPAGVRVGPGDDTAEVEVRNGRALFSTDILVENRHFRRDWSSAYDVGRRAAAANMADIAAMGGTATALTVGFAAPGDLPAQWACDLASGIADEAALVGAAVVGGDVTSAEHVIVSVSVLGTCEGDPVLRSGARPGDVVAAAGRIGWAGAGYHVLARGFRSPRVLVEAYRRPEPDYEAGPDAAAAGASALIDACDGLVADLGHIASSSGVAIDVRTDAFEVAEPLQAVGAALGVDPLTFILSGGDDHTMLATFGPEVVLGERWRRIGTVATGEGVRVDGEPYQGEAGHQHFR